MHRRPVDASVSKPSTVVMTPFCVPGGISNCSSGTVTVALFDLTTCRRSRSVRPFATCVATS